MSKEDLLRLEYVPLDQVVLWEDNPKLHDIGAMAEAFGEHGFKDPAKYEPHLNSGKGGLGHGNGRGATLKWMKRQGQKPPRGVAVLEDGRWAMPVLFGVDAASEAAAKAYAVDHNNLTMAGGNFSTWDMARMWDDGYDDLMLELAAEDSLPVTVDNDALDDLLASFDHPPSLDDLADKYGKSGERDFWPVIRIQVSPETYAMYESLMAIAPVEDEALKFEQLMSAVDAAVFGTELP